MIPTELLILIAVVAVLLAVAVFGVDTIERLRRRRYEQAAADLSFQFHDKDQAMLPEGASRFHLMRLGQVRVAERIMRGEANGVGVTIFEICNTSGLAFNTRVTSQTVVAFDGATLSLPWFFIRPSALGEKLPPPPGLVDIDLGGEPPLAATHSLAREPEGEGRILEVLNQRLVTLLKASPDVCIEAWGQVLMIYYPGRAVPLGEYPGFLQEAFRFYGLFKRDR